MPVKKNLLLFKAIFILVLSTGTLEASPGRKNLCLERTRAKLEKVDRFCLLVWPDSGLRCDQFLRRRITLAEANTAGTILFNWMSLIGLSYSKENVIGVLIARAGAATAPGTLGSTSTRLLASVCPWTTTVKSGMFFKEPFNLTHLLKVIIKKWS